MQHHCGGAIETRNGRVRLGKDDFKFQFHTGCGVHTTIKKSSSSLFSTFPSLLPVHTHCFAIKMGIYTKLADDIQEVDVIIAGGK
jgi:hypothetical protein